MAVEFEIRICSKRNAPTGTMPERECSRRKTNEYPCPARNGATPAILAIPLFVPGAVVLADATKRSYKFVYEKRTSHYRAPGELKSRNAVDESARPPTITNANSL